MDPETGKKRLDHLRERMAGRNLVACLVPHEDAHQGEYPPPSEERLAWLSGFTGSAGMAVVTTDRAALFVDGRYTVQAAAEAPPELWTHLHVRSQPPWDWLGEWLAGQGTQAQVGFDPRLHTPDGLERFRNVLKARGAALTPVEGGLIDPIWSDRPDPPSGAAIIHPLQFAGRRSREKREDVIRELARDGMQALVVTAPENLAWLFNLRGADLEHTPLALGFGILHGSGDAAIYLDPAKVTDSFRNALDGEEPGRVRLRDPADFWPDLARLTGMSVRVDRISCNVAIFEKLKSAGARPVPGDDPCTALKACKNPVELDGARAAHLRDGVAMTRFLAWFAHTAPGTETEWSVAEKLESFRREGAHYKTPSFPTISASAHNAALPHYRMDRDSARRLQADDIYLFDSGGQYLDGTTDVTRVTVTGQPTADMCRRYSQVLKGHLALGAARFPAGVSGAQLDALARRPLWEAGVDFDHGTGHGVGSYLGVHEGPQSISRVGRAILKPGMILSNEPGYYKQGAFGIRIENLVAVVHTDPPPPGAEHENLCFETLTLVPYERTLIDCAMLDGWEIAAVDAYHRRVMAALAPHLTGDDLAWLEAATAPLEPV